MRVNKSKYKDGLIIIISENWRLIEPITGRPKCNDSKVAVSGRLLHLQIVSELITPSNLLSFFTIYKMSTNSVLRPILAENFPNLLEILKEKLPDSILAYHWTATHLHWAQNIPSLKVKILCLNGDWRRGAMVGLTDGLAESNKILGMIYAPEDECESLNRCLKATELIEWERVKCFVNNLDRFLPTLTEILKQKGFKHSGEFHDSCLLLYLPAEEAANIPLKALPEKVRVGSLDNSHLDIVCENWRHYHPDYRPVVQKMIQLNATVGVFVTNEQNEEELASMVLHTDYGGFGILQTVPKFRRKGFASIALAHIVRALGLKGFMPFGTVLAWNEDSVNLLKKFGFKVLEASTWLELEKE
ncbi:uncharacterized protein LOC132197234 [Neocloeon triangulifer]|uniref:uncharacterized protein LOC132197234 n=1 Tax=Neocloeon triangulifer TaxID=2078957 RepID=UPI00286F3220|nr:uncharacterized protein LOC132197234 [Neocloeon triangulifer]